MYATIGWGGKRRVREVLTNVDMSQGEGEVSGSCLHALRSLLHCLEGKGHH